MALHHVVMSLLSAAAPDPDARPALSADAPILCTEDPRGVPVRLQCEPPGHPGVCLVAPACAQGLTPAAPFDRSACRWLERTRACDYPDAELGFDALVAGRPLVPARADADDGWWRDAEGRVFQVAFDLNQRFWLGARWLGTFHDGAPAELGGAGLDVGFRADVLGDDARTKTRFRFLEADLSLSPFSLRARLLAVDTSSDGDEPFLRITTFVGEPQRHDVYLTAGWWLELLSIEHAPRGSRDDSFVRIVGAGITWDLWHDVDMTSYLRLRGGVALDDIVRRGADSRVAATPLIALEGDLVFDRAGFHRLVLASSYEASYFEDPADGEGTASHARFMNELAYEVILIAVDDQPVTLRVGVQGGHRDDLGDPALDGWELSAMAGLRWSLWAPTPDREGRERAAARRAGRAP